MYRRPRYITYHSTSLLNPITEPFGGQTLSTTNSNYETDDDYGSLTRNTCSCRPYRYYGYGRSDSTSQYRHYGFQSARYLTRYDTHIRDKNRLFRIFK